MHKNLIEIFDTAAHTSAITYWAKGKDFLYDKAGNVVSMKIADSGPDGDPVKLGWRIIGPKTLIRARNKLVNGKVNVSRDIISQFVGPVENWSFDADGVDALIQVAFFGDLTYG